MAKMRITFEFEQQELSVTPQLLKQYWTEVTGGDKDADQNREQGIESEKALLAAIKAQPEIMRKLWLQRVIFWLHMLENYQVTGLVKPVVPELVDLQPVVADLPEAARNYFELPGMLDGYDSEPLFDYVFSLNLCGVRIEDTQGVLLSSDDAPIRRGKKR